jgi:hypothetical protein
MPESIIFEKIYQRLLVAITGDVDRTRSPA